MSALDSQNRLYVYDGVRISRLTATGAPDPHFSSYTVDNTILAMVVDSRDQLLFVEEKHVSRPLGIKNYITTDASARICRLSETGELDLAKTFWSELGMISYVNHVARVGLAAAKNGAFYLAVFVAHQNLGTMIGTYGPIRRWHASGEIDQSFSSHLHGNILFDPSTENLYVFQATPASESISGPQVFSEPLRLLPDGRVDPTFNSAGISFAAATPYTAPHINDAALFQDGTLLIAGRGTHITSSGTEILSLTKYIYHPVTPTKPVIAEPPASIYAVSGTDARLEVVASGTPPLRYSWTRGNQIVSSENYLSLGNVSARDAGDYTVTVTNAQGSTTASIELVVVPRNPVVLTQPKPSVFRGDPIILEAFVTGLSPLSYQWFKDGAPLPGARAPVLALPPMPESAGEYVLVAANDHGTVSTDTIRIEWPTLRLAALSARCAVGTGAQTLIMGLVLQGPSDKQMLVRGIGPAIAPQVTTALRDPRLKLFRHAPSAVALHAANENWSGTSDMLETFARLGASPLEIGSLDAALFSAMEGGVYTAHVESSNGEPGIVLAEIYDTDLSHPTRLKALSTRAIAGAGEDTLIAGFVLEGVGEKRILVRGLGPALVQRGVSESHVLKNPILKLYKMTRGASALIGENDDWNGDPALQEAFTLAGAGALDLASRDAALLITLTAGVYTAHITNAEDATGVALIEIFELQ